MTGTAGAPRNVAVGVNDRCTRCLAVARAYQHVVDVEPGTELDETALQELEALEQRARAVVDRLVLKAVPPQAHRPAATTCSGRPRRPPSWTAWARRSSSSSTGALEPSSTASGSGQVADSEA